MVAVGPALRGIKISSTWWTLLDFFSFRKAFSGFVFAAQCGMDVGAIFSVAWVTPAVW
jgi:hypothetical protein